MSPQGFRALFEDFRSFLELRGHFLLRDLDGFLLREPVEEQRRFDGGLGGGSLLRAHGVPVDPSLGGVDAFLIEVPRGGFDPAVDLALGECFRRIEHVGVDELLDQLRPELLLVLALGPLLGLAAKLGFDFVQRIEAPDILGELVIGVGKDLLFELFDVESDVEAFAGSLGVASVGRLRRLRRLRRKWR